MPRVRRCLLVIAVMAALAGPHAGVGDASGHHEDDASWGALDLVEARRGVTRVVGWVATREPGPPQIRLSADGVAVAGEVPTQRRIDVERVLPRGMTAWGWDVDLDFEVTDSVCAGAVIGGAPRGIACWARSASTMLPAAGGGEVIGTDGPLITYSVEVEAATGLHPDDVARLIETVLADPRSWAGAGDGRFQRVRPHRADERIYVASPATTDRLCLPFLTGGRLSCNVRDTRIVFNVDRWSGAVAHWTASVADYRAYLINHELGHSLDFRHVGCPGPGELAPLMMQQTKSLDGCLPNAWPYPTVTSGASDANAPTTRLRVGEAARHLASLVGHGLGAVADAAKESSGQAVIASD